jgi:heme A synthase
MDRAVKIIRRAKRASIVLGAALALVGCLGVWMATLLQAEQGRSSLIVLSVLFSAAAVIQGVRFLTWDRRSKPTVLMRAQLADALPVILPVAMFASFVVSAPSFADPANPSLWLAIIFMASVAVSVVPAEKAELSEVPPLRSVGFWDWLRWQNFGFGTLFASIYFTFLYFLAELRAEPFTPLIIVLAVAQAAVSVWRIIEHRRLSRTGVRLSGMQIGWLRAIHVNRGHEAAVKELRMMYPKIGPTHADTVVENLYQAEERL